MKKTVYVGISMNALAREPSAKEKKCTTDTSGIEHVTSHPHGIHCFAALMLVSAVRKYADLSGYLLNRRNCIKSGSL